MDKLVVSTGGGKKTLKGELLHWKPTTKGRELSLQSAMDRTHPNELKMNRGKVQVKHWKRGDKNIKKNKGRVVKNWKRFHQERALKTAEANTSS